MKKTLFLIVVVLNLVYFGYTYLRSLEMQSASDADQTAPELKVIRDEANKEGADAQPKTATVSEPTVSPAPVAETPAPSPGARRPMPKLARQSCFELGPFRRRHDATKALRTLDTQLVDAAIEPREKKLRHRYWIYIPPLKSRRAARQEIRRLKRLGVTDLILLTQGEKKNAISLGIYQYKQNFERRLRYLRRLGLKPESDMMYRTRVRYWLSYGHAHKQGLTEADVLRVTPGKSSLSERPTTCR